PVDHAARPAGEIFARQAQDAAIAGGLERRAAERVHVLALLRVQHPDPLAVAEYLHRRRGDEAVQRVVLRDAEVSEGVGGAVATAQRYRLARPGRRLGLGLEGHPAEGDA